MRCQRPHLSKGQGEGGDSLFNLPKLHIVMYLFATATSTGETSVWHTGMEPGRLRVGTSVFLTTLLRKERSERRVLESLRERKKGLRVREGARVSWETTVATRLQHLYRTLLQSRAFTALEKGNPLPCYQFGCLFVFVFCLLFCR